MTFEILAHVLFRTYILWAIIDMRWKVVASFKTVVRNFSFNRDSTCGFHYADTVSAYLLTIGRNCISLFVYYADIVSAYSLTMQTLYQHIRWLCGHCLSLFVDYADIVSEFSLILRILSQLIQTWCLRGCWQRGHRWEISRASHWLYSTWTVGWINFGFWEF